MSSRPSAETRGRKHAPSIITDGQCSIVSEKTTEFADGTVKKETFFSDGTKITVHSESVDDIVISSEESAKKVPGVVTPKYGCDDDDVTELTGDFSKRKKKRSYRGSYESSFKGKWEKFIFFKEEDPTQCSFCSSGL
jgi:hypothetical protein|mmetsp:Transcript_30553/g.55287  ORF Transcript_30553/g.55287 Transcript_30553/m.55287 type:complete len:137 (+) Transcript_30553:2325-2735(+)